MNEIEDNGYVKIEFCDDPYSAFPAYVAAERWNGFAVPYFTKETAQKIVEWTHKLAEENPGEDACAQWDGDTVVVVEPSYPDKPDRYAPDANGRYGIGAKGWTWVGVPEEYWPEKLDQMVARAQQEINEDIDNGVVPSTVQSFSELHDYVDANVYGGLCDDDNDAPTDVVRAIQERVDRWLSAQRPSEAT